MKYRIRGGRQGEQPEDHIVFTADSDDNAKKVFNEFSDRPENKGDHYTLLRVDKDPVPEETTLVAEAGRIPNDDWSL